MERICISIYSNNLLTNIKRSSFLIFTFLVFISFAHTESKASTQTSVDWLTRHSLYFKRNWGIDILGVRPASSGQMLTFRYRVIDVDKAKPIFDKTAIPYIIDGATGTRLAVPAMENVGELRQDALLISDRTYFIIFGNPGQLVKSGNHISVVIGDFHIDDMVVD